MDLDRHVIRPMTEETGLRAVFGLSAGIVAGTAIALPVLISVFGI